MKGCSPSPCRNRPQVQVRCAAVCAGRGMHSQRQCAGRGWCHSMSSRTALSRSCGCSVHRCIFLQIGDIKTAEKYLQVVKKVTETGWAVRVKKTELSFTLVRIMLQKPTDSYRNLKESLNKCSGQKQCRHGSALPGQSQGLPEAA